MKRNQIKRFIGSRQVTKRDFARVQEQELRTNYVQQQHLVDNNVFSLGQIRTYEKNKLLSSVRYKGGKYFKKDDVFVLISQSGNRTGSLNF